jgi:hypothetical protein
MSPRSKRRSQDEHAERARAQAEGHAAEKVGRASERAAEKIERATERAGREVERAREQVERSRDMAGEALIWFREEPCARRPSHTRTEIARAAIEIADSEGLNAVSMRCVAQSSAPAR